ncbi:MULTISPECIES: sugar transferase [Citrobacter freundii complex]|uniref:sugar transferase n=1 Tax=Citrobacter freundii complex TaxID=1344959 RepID=UPI000CD3079B|nr:MULTISPECIES: sugar transferase [Citrobacter freundii complex]MBA7977911.1 sugar transferase [Citrobacter freundii]AUV44353.1 sugar transferase [Citrobacter freundii complex sp. CFNIH9]MCW8354256.1 sugar transferase [Citrobacter portucalensis]MCX8971805.1 sugar transferase [Citrobacter portucalensis]MCX8995207.1 sugar transferase [Citrobacter portucalensis]
MLKRLFDIFTSLILIICLSPILVVTYILVRRKLGKPALFRQIRPGKDGRPFEMIKFRSMKDAYDSTGKILSDEVRLTEFGRKIRALSLDELPELWNVLKGDMSLVGPRPLLMSYLELYSMEQKRRHEVRPGITGWAQVNGRNAISWNDKFKLDVWYVDNQSLLLDLKILILTLKKTYKREGISSEGHVTVEPFKGNQDE